MRSKDRGRRLEMSKKCLFCGSVLDDEAQFCDDCGKKQEQITASINQVPTNAQYYNNQPGQNSLPVQPVQGFSGAYPAQPNTTAKPKDNYNVFAWIGLGLGIVSYILIYPLILPTLITSVIGLVFSIIGTKSPKKTVSIISIVLNALALLIFILLILAVVAVM